MAKVREMGTIHTRHWRSSGFAFAMALLLGGAFQSSPADAAVTKTWLLDSYRDFNEGEAKSAVITSSGYVRPGWATQRTELEFGGGVWSSLRLANGDVLLGTDDRGTLYRARAGKVTKLAEFKGIVATVALAMGTGNNVYVGTMPKGQVWRVDTSTGKKRLLTTIKGAETVWGLTVGPSGRYLFAGTGPKGKLYRIDLKSGTSKAVFSTEDKRILTVVTGKDGGIWLGTSSRAQVFRFDPKTNRARAMADFSGNEISAIAPYRGGLVVAANEFKAKSTSGIKTRGAVQSAKAIAEPGQKAVRPDVGSVPGADKVTSSSAKIKRPGARKGKGALFYVRADGQLEQLHALTQTYFTALVVDKNNTVYAGAGDKGRIYMVQSDGSVATAFDVGERMITSMVLDPSGGLRFTTGDASAYYRVSGISKNSSYVTKVLDTKAPSKFGKLRWRGQGSVGLEVRSGNTAKPGPGWSAWKSPTGVRRAGASGSLGKILSPRGRYVQVRARFSGDSSAELRHLMLYYLPQNRPTRIKSIKVRRDGAEDLPTLKRGVAKPRSPLLRLSWNVSNEDRDATHYKVEARREGEQLWRLVAGGPEDRLSSTSFRWNTETFADGYYRVRVTADDRQENSAGRAIQTRRQTELFLVDNNKPEINNIRVAGRSVTARATDSLSAISEMAYSIDNGYWQLGATADGLFDDPIETLRFSLPNNLRAGVHRLTIRVADEAGNIGSATTTFRVR